MTPTQVYDSVRNQFFETTPSFIGEAELYSYLWQAEYEMIKRLQCYETTDTSITTVASTREYSFPSGVMEIRKITYDSYPLKKIDMSELDQVEESAYGFTGSEGNCEYYYEWSSKIGLSPIPDAAKAVKLWTINEPAELDSSSTAFSMPAWLGPYLSDYCLYKMYLKDEDANRASVYLQLWSTNLIKAKNEYDGRKRYNRRQIVKDVDSMPGTDIGII